MQVKSRSGRQLGRLLTLALGCGGAMISGAAGQEYCVACTEPNAVYRCVVDGARPGGRQPLQLLCIMAMTKEGGHASCGARSGTVFECDGPIRRVPWADHNVGIGPEPVPEPPKEAAADADKDTPPATVEEAIRRANAKTAEQLRQANEKMKTQAQAVGQGISDASKKTWRCLSSLFTSCGD
jgi:hypothetical protein